MEQSFCSSLPSVYFEGLSRPWSMFLKGLGSFHLHFSYQTVCVPILYSVSHFSSLWLRRILVLLVNVAEAGEGALWLRALTALVGDPGPICKCHMVLFFNNGGSATPVSEDLVSPSGLYAYVWCTYRQAGKTLTRITNKICFNSRGCSCMGSHLGPQLYARDPHVWFCSVLGSTMAPSPL